MMGLYIRKNTCPGINYSTEILHIAGVFNGE